MRCFPPPMLISGHWFIDVVVFGVGFSLVSSPLLALLNFRAERSRRATVTFCAILAAIPMTALLWLSWVWALPKFRSSRTESGYRSAARPYKVNDLERLLAHFWRTLVVSRRC
jgi:hypothetical protein